MEPKWPLSWLEFGPSFGGLFRPKVVDKQVVGIHVFTKVTSGHLGYLGSKANRLNSFAKEKQQIHTHHESMSQFVWSLPSSVEHISSLAKFLQSLEHDVLLLAKICLICFKKSKYQKPWSNQVWMGCVKIKDPKKNISYIRFSGSLVLAAMFRMSFNRGWFPFQMAQTAYKFKWGLPSS